LPLQEVFGIESVVIEIHSNNGLPLMLVRILIACIQGKTDGTGRTTGH
jgi:hypothetical protein